jgi:uncharacterized membrane protein
MLTFNFRREWLSLTAIAAMFLISLIIYPSLPDVIPTHWDINGQADNFAPKSVGAWALPALSIVLYAILYLAPYFDPKRASLERSADTYILIRTVTMLFFLFIHSMALYSTFQGDQSLSTMWLTLGMGVLFMVLGNYMPRMKPSWIAGIRTPWTISSETVWTKTHRFGGRVFVLGGLVVCLTAFLPIVAGTILMIATLATTTLIPIAYSYWIWRQEQI